MFFRCLLFSLLTALVSCESTAPTAAQMDELEVKVRAQHREDYAQLDQQRSAGEITAEKYADEHVRLDNRVRNKVDTMLWNRHALAQSDMKANGIPTPDAPVNLTPPGVGQTQGSLYNSMRQNGMGMQSQGGNLMRDMGGANFNQRRSGTIYDGR